MEEATMAIDPGLDPQNLAGYLKSDERRINRSIEMIHDHMPQPEGYVAFSGGKDSLASLVLTREIYPEIPVVFFDSDLEYPENREYIYQIADILDLNLTVIPASQSLLTLVVSHGWFSHEAEGELTEDLYEVKIERPSRIAHDQFGRYRIWGLRMDESKGRRMLLAKHRGITPYVDGRIGIAPLWDWRSEQVKRYLNSKKLPVNPVYQKLAELGVEEKDQRVGMMFEGSNLDFGRMTWLKRGWPQTYDRIRSLMPRVEEYR